MKLLREPLIHFLLLGAGLFLLSGLLATSEGEDKDRIVVSPGRIEHLVTGFSRTWQRPPTHQELEGLIEDYIKEEVWYREAQAMGLDQDDTVIRRRLRQKMEFLSEDFVATSAPTDAELTAYLDQHSEQFRIGSKISFTHVYLSPDRRGDDADQDAERLKVELLINPALAVNETIGDPFPLSHEIELLSESQVANLFGKNFADHVFTLELHTWSGPIESGYGIHLVFVRERVEGRIPTLEEARAVVQREWESTTRREAKESLYQELRDQYLVTVEYPEELRQGNSTSPGAGNTK